jgi:hypothetical protein
MQSALIVRALSDVAPASAARSAARPHRQPWTAEPPKPETDVNDTRPRPSWGMRFTERYLLRFFGPPDLGAGRSGRRANAAETAREAQLNAELTRVIGPDGRAYLVRRDRQGDTPA